MATFTIKYRSRGEIKSTKLSADNLEMAKRQAQRFGGVLSVTRDASGFGKKGMSSADRYTFLVRLGTMLASRMSTADALRLLRDSFTGTISDAAMRLLERISAGIDLPTAIAEERTHFPGSIGLIIKVSAKSGQIAIALKDAASFEQRLGQIKRGSGRVIVSAVFGFIMAAVLVAASVFYIGPEIMKMGIMASQKDKIDVGWINNIAAGIAIFISVTAVIMLGLLWLATMGRSLFPEWADKIILRIPYYSDIVMAQDNYLVLRRLSLMIGSGVRVEEALQSAYEGAKKGLLKHDLERALVNLKTGQKWSTALSTLHPTDRAALSLAADRSQIAQNLDMIAEQSQDLYIQRVNSFAPVLMVVSAIAVTLAGLVLFGQTVLPMLQIAAKLLT